MQLKITKTKDKKNDGRIIISTIKFSFIVGIIIFCILFGPSLTLQNISIFIKNNKIFAPVVFISLCTLRPVLFFLPSMGLTIIAGLLFGVFWGTFYVVIGGMFSTAVGFYFAKFLGRETVKKLIDKIKLLKSIEKTSIEHGRKTVLLLRVFNVPWDIVSYWAGISGINFKDFYVASMVPLIPISFLYTYFGSNIFTPTNPGFIISLLLILIMGAIPYLISKYKK